MAEFRMWRTVVVLVCVLLVELEASQNWRQKRSRLQKCGDQLTQSLMILCDNKYNKRNHEASDMTALPWTPFNADNKELEQDSGPWWTRSRAVALMARVRRGVVDECCSKACSIRELSSYCLDSTSVSN